MTTLLPREIESSWRGFRASPREIVEREREILSKKGKSQIGREKRESTHWKELKEDKQWLPSS